MGLVEGVPEGSRGISAKETLVFDIMLSHDFLVCEVSKHFDGSGGKIAGDERELR